ncbi:hypothetical protein UFOVP917_23 [uncultured Caudovirales phage]|uniref:Uncharacterized protein n=1 Tax=uncultured Caudovirales phage TaxID=2100421 RepID=A0A6J5SIJ0_9CAUD|nr:hypothetical protein UFOVP297_1 [uncultured Caudovirales phage]CAB4171245.1 hypothetical protein UFOVP917_23 [uncultured Caudovirales phage]CAB4182807.1 hypothetical protein UFOVP1094_25 [uncultured Caudovirales phage]CAB4200191.1 hypothetical protein UFOVP1342_25 [uncultured Caudovirales phage]CAB4213502.1 hypothetical protein UFOVP1450_33 [uncultured Caudovirales phage]
MSIPTEKQALVFWLAASGMSCRMIGEEIGISPEAARNLLVKAQQKAKRIGLEYKVSLKKPEPMPNESGMGIAMRLAREANLIK